MIYTTKFVSNFQSAVSYYNEIDYNAKSSKRKKFSPEEDQTIKILIQNGAYDWQNVSKYLPGRTAKQCRDRYVNYLSNNFSNEPWNKEEDEILLMYLSFIGTKWVEISHHIPGRSGNKVKNRWYKHLSNYYSFTPGNAKSLTNLVQSKNNLITQTSNEKNNNEQTSSNIQDKYICMGTGHLLN